MVNTIQAPSFESTCQSAESHGNAAYELVVSAQCFVSRCSTHSKTYGSERGKTLFMGREKVVGGLKRCFVLEEIRWEGSKKKRDPKVAEGKQCQTSQD